MQVSLETVEEKLDELRQHVERLGSHDYRVIGAATQALLQAGSSGFDAILQGMSHSHPRVRRGCTDFMDHYGDDRCIAALIDTARHDPVPQVRRSAVHSLGCQRCKACPLNADLVGFMVERALRDENVYVRCEAIWALRWQPQEDRVASALHRILKTEITPVLIKAARHVLQFHDPEYRQQVVERAKEREQCRRKSESEAAVPD